MGGDRWRALLPLARDIARELAAAETIEIVQKGEPVDPKEAWRGPVRLRLVAG